MKVDLSTTLGRPVSILSQIYGTTSAAKAYESHRLHPEIFEPDSWDMSSGRNFEEWLDPRFLALIERARHVSSSEDEGEETEESPIEAARDGEEAAAGHERAGAPGGYSFYGSEDEEDEEDKAARVVEQAAARRGAAAAAELESAGLLKIEAPGVYSFPMFSTQFCSLFLEEVDNFYLTGIPARGPNSMNNYGVIVNDIGLRPALNMVQQQLVLPLVSALFPLEGAQLDGHHSFMVRYRADGDKGLDMHTDDSDVTLNICLGREGFKASGLTFCGKFGTPDHRQFTSKVKHQIGRAVVHLGQQRHGADDISLGERNNLIIWNHNLAYRQSDVFLRRMQRYEREGGPPDDRCLSFTHDKDWLTYRKAYPAGQEELADRAWCPPKNKRHRAWGGLDHLA